MGSSSHSWRQNRILAGLSAGDEMLIGPYLRNVRLTPRQRIETSGQLVSTIFFPTSGSISVMIRNGLRRQKTEVCTIGPESMTGISVLLGHVRASLDMVVQMEGEAQSIASSDMRRLAVVSTSLRERFLRHAYTLLVQTAQGSLANAKGGLEERLARRLLMAHDRAPTGQLPLTHEDLAEVLGVRRSGVTIALQRLEWQGAIKMARKLITIADRNKLESCAHGFYDTFEGDLAIAERDDRKLLGSAPDSADHKKPAV